jgi:hypothetical protein
MSIWNLHSVEIVADILEKYIYIYRVIQKEVYTFKNLFYKNYWR